MLTIINLFYFMNNNLKEYNNFRKRLNFEYYENIK